MLEKESLERKSCPRVDRSASSIQRISESGDVCRQVGACLPRPAHRHTINHRAAWLQPTDTLWLWSRAFATLPSHARARNPATRSQGKGETIATAARRRGLESPAACCAWRCIYVEANTTSGMASHRRLASVMNSAITGNRPVIREPRDRSLSPAAPSSLGLDQVASLQPRQTSHA